MTSSTDPDRGNHSYSYDADGHLLTDVSGTRTLGTSYDLLGRAGCVQDAAPSTNGYGGCSNTAHPLIQYAYDITTLGTSGSSDFSLGQMTRSIATTYYPDGSAATTTQQAQHDQRGRLTSATQQLGIPSSWNVTTALPTYQQNLTYNDANQLMTTQTTVGGQPGYTFSQAYDSSTGLLTGLSNNTLGVANLATLGYDVTGHVSDLNFQTTTGTQLATEHFTYDGDLRPASASATWQSGSGSTGTIFSQSRGYDPVGNVASISTMLAAVPGQSGSGGSETQNFCYDEENRLVWAGNSGTQPAPGIGTCGSGTLANSISGASYSTSYAYTHLGQLWQGPLNGSGTQQQYLYCDNTHPHQLTGLFPIGTTCASLTGAVYTSSNDAWGNVTNRVYSSTNAVLSYDQLDHFVQWNAGANSQEWYAYDMGGNRTLRRSMTSSGTTITVYAFGLEVYVYSSSGTPQSSTYYYTLGGRLLGEVQGSTTQFFLTDGLGSVLTTFTASAGSAAVQGNQVYGPYGTSRYSKGAMGTTKGFTGQYADATGLDYYNARYYDPVVGRFLSADMVQSNMQGMDPYDYVGGNPETNTDPTGHRQEGIDDGSSANIDPQGTLTIWTPFPSYGVGHGYNENGNYAYHVEHYTSKQQKQPAYQPPRRESMASKIGHLIWALLVGSTAGVSFGLSHVGPVCMLSFAPATRAATAQGAKAINALHPGDNVWAYNPKTHKMELQPIVHVWVNHDDDLVDLTVTSKTSVQQGKPAQKTVEVIHTNQKHPFLTVEKGFVPVSLLSVGMHLVKADDGVGIVTKLEIIPGTMAMYNLEVANDHTFTVGESKWIVHNCTPSSGGFDTSPFSDSGDLSGASMDQLLARIPQDASSRVLLPGRTPDGRPSGVQEGFEYTWKDGDTTYDFRPHGPNSNISADRNAGQGWNWRLMKTVGGRSYYLDRYGNWIPSEQVTPGNPAFSEDAINNTHIPMRNYTGDPSIAPSPTGTRIIPDAPFEPEDPEIPDI